MVFTSAPRRRSEIRICCTSGRSRSAQHTDRCRCELASPPPAQPSVGVPAEDAGDRLDKDPQIEPYGPFLDISKVMLDPALHLIERLGLAAETVHLRPSGDARLHAVPRQVTVDPGCEVLVMWYGVRAWPDQRHLPLQHIQQLGQFVEAGSAQNFSHPRYAGI